MAELKAGYEFIFPDGTDPDAFDDKLFELAEEYGVLVNDSWPGER